MQSAAPGRAWCWADRQQTNLLGALAHRQPVPRPLRCGCARRQAGTGLYGAAAAGPGIAGAPAGHCTGRTRHAQRNFCRASHARLPRVRPPRPGCCSKPVRPRPLRRLSGPAGARAGQGAAAAARPCPAAPPGGIRIAIVRQRKQGPPSKARRADQKRGWPRTVKSGAAAPGPGLASAPRPAALSASAAGRAPGRRPPRRRARAGRAARCPARAARPARWASLRWPPRPTAAPAARAAPQAAAARRRWWPPSRARGRRAGSRAARWRTAAGCRRAPPPSRRPRCLRPCPRLRARGARQRGLPLDGRPHALPGRMHTREQASKGSRPRRRGALVLPLPKPDEKVPTPALPPAALTGTSASAACVLSRPETSCAPAAARARPWGGRHGSAATALRRAARGASTHLGSASRTPS